MKVSYHKKRVKLTESLVDIDEGLMAKIILIPSILLLVITATFSIWSVTAIMLLLVGIKLIKSKLTQKSIDITPKGLRILEDKQENQFFELKNIKNLYLHVKNNRTQLFINDNKKEVIILSGYYDRVKLVRFITRILSLTVDKKKETSQGTVYKLISQEIIETRKQHFELASSVEHQLVKSKYFTVENKKNITTIENQNSNGILSTNKTILDHNSETLIIHPSNASVNKIPLSVIKDIDIAISSEASGSNTENITGQLVASTISGKKIIIFHCELLQSNFLDFISDELINDLTALKAIINIQIKQKIDKSLEILDLDKLQENLEKQKDVLPKRDKGNL